MSNSTIEIREIQPEDNKQMEAVIREVFIEYNLPLVGTAYADAETPKMFESYAGDKEVYFVVTVDAPNFESAAAVKLATEASGAVTNLNIMEPININNAAKIAAKAAGSYKPPGK